MSKHKRIVVAEDSVTQAEQTKHLLTTAGYEVEVCVNGQLAYESICESMPQMLISDILMPVMNGYELCHKVKQNAETNSLPVVLLTTLDSPEDVKKGLISGADDFLPKPINEKLLVEHVNRLLDQRNFGKNHILEEEIPTPKVLNFLMSTYETALLKAKELEKTKNELSVLNLILEKKVDERTKLLNQRVKELNCLHEINDLYESIDYTSNELLKQTSFILKNSFINSDKVEISIVMNERRYRTKDFNPDFEFKLSSPIKSMRTIIGTIEVSFNDEVYENPFSLEEKQLVDSVAQRMFELYELGEKEQKIVVQNADLREKVEKIEKINSELDSARMKAVESDRLKSAFLANMSHEIRTPLNSIVGFTDIFDDPEIDVKTRGYYGKIIKDSSMHLLAIVNDVLDISKIETGQMQICFEDCCLQDEMDSIYNLFAKGAEEKGIKLVMYNMISNECMIYTDVKKFRQIFTNLISNAIKFTAEGAVEFGVLRIESKITFYVKDTGIGIPEAYKTKIFDRFIQVESSTIRNYGGTGLGLAISKRLVELLGGEIWFESEMNKGSIFYFNISLSPEECLEIKSSSATDQM